jgi:hypothetical protein
MSILTASSSASQIVHRFRRTGGAEPETLITADPDRDENRDGWNNLIASKLAAWEVSTDSLDDGDSIPPSPIAIAVALFHAHHWRDAGLACPMDIIPDGDAGILFQITKTPSSEFSINVLSDGSIDKLLFVGDRLRKREHFPIG